MTLKRAREASPPPSRPASTARLGEAVMPRFLGLEAYAEGDSNVDAEANGEAEVGMRINATPESGRDEPLETDEEKETERPAKRIKSVLTPSPKYLLQSSSTSSLLSSAVIHRFSSPPASFVSTPRKINCFSSLSDELLIRVLHLLPVECVLTVQAVSRKFRRLASDGQVWKGLYYARWVRPRVLRLPRSERELPIPVFSSRKSKWLDEGRLLDQVLKEPNGMRGNGREKGNEQGAEGRDEKGLEIGSDREAVLKPAKPKDIDWKARYKLRHNWSIGAAELRKIELGFGMDADSMQDELDFKRDETTLMARLVDGGIITVDVKEGLRAWDLKRKECIAQCVLTGHHGANSKSESVPTCLSVDSSSERGHDPSVVIGFQDGGFEIWKLRHDIRGEEGYFEMRYRSPAVEGDDALLNLDTKLDAVAYSHPYFLTITTDHVLSLYLFDGDAGKSGVVEQSDIREDLKDTDCLQAHKDPEQLLTDTETKAPRLLSSLKSHTCWPPLCLSIRSTPQRIIASIAYALPTYLSGWSVGLQELHLTRSGTIIRSRLASAMDQGFHSLLSLPTSSSPSLLSRSITPESNNNGPAKSRSAHGRGAKPPPPMSLSYSHPYLLAGNRDNTLSLYLVTSNNEELKICKSNTLWGHTSSVSGAHVGGRGKAVSVSARGEELRIWELEAGLGRKNVVLERSVLVRGEGGGEVTRRGSDHDFRSTGAGRWVGFDDDVVVVLKEDGGGEGGKVGRALVVYDFT